MIELTDQPVETYPVPRIVLVRRALSAPAPAALVVLALVFLAAYLRLTTPTVVHQVTAVLAEHEVFAGLSGFPASATGQWLDAAGVAHDLDPNMDTPVRLPARALVVAVSTSGVQCTLQVDGVTVDFATAGPSGPGVCSWVG